MVKIESFYVCDICDKQLFNNELDKITILNAEAWFGIKPYHFHLCNKCRKRVISLIREIRNTETKPSGNGKTGEEE